ncbi:MAG: hypothetical protein ACTHLA_13225 [Asticcacaulis sp.]|uniref:hypothetical protein n=1 Tax=Asticcacaulis sp. TaxID=1872648 RepID=UPI003F7B823D
MKETKIYAVEKRFKEVFGLMTRDDLYIRETPAKTFIVTVPHPSEDIEYVLSVYRHPNEPKEFVDLGRCVKTALELGAASIHFRISNDEAGAS